MAGKYKRAPGNVKTTWQFLRGKGLTPAQAAGVIGSMQGESGPNLDPNAENPSSHAIGIAQWLGARAVGVRKGDLQGQLNHLWHELETSESGALSALKATHDPASASHAWQAAFERGAPFEQKYDLRAANAKNVLDSMRGVGGSSTTSTSSTPSTPTISSGPTLDVPGYRQAAREQLLANLITKRNPHSFLLRSGLLSTQPVDVNNFLSPLTSGPPSISGAPSISSTPTRSSSSPSGEKLPGIKNKSPLFELIHKDPSGQGFGVKNGQVVQGSQVFSGVWAGHADHVHVAAGPKTIVALGDLAQKMGLHVGENPHFGGVSDVHVPGSYHYKGEAIDVSSPDNKLMDRFASAVERIYRLRRK